MFFRRKKPNHANAVRASSNYKILLTSPCFESNAIAWCDDEVARRQHEAYRALIDAAYGGNIRRDFQVAAAAIRATLIESPMLLEVGCGSGYYSEILTYLLNQQFGYVGLDYSSAMVRLASAKYPMRQFVRADSTRLPFSNHRFDIVLNGVSLMHTLDYVTAISEARRTSRSWCIFHTVPVLQRRPTTMLQKTAYGGGPVLELIFNEPELIAIFNQNGLKIESSVESIPYDLENILGEKTLTKTFLCHV
jgi:ubiquinone/menaquinone biosynthesis C-methylase UbiE